MIPVTALAFAQALEAKAMKKTGIPIGKYDAIAEVAGKTKIKPKQTGKTVPQRIAARKRKKWRAAK